MDASTIRVLAVPTFALFSYLLPLRFSQKQLLQTAFVLWALGGLSLGLTGVFRITDTMAFVSLPVLLITLIVAIAVGIGKGKFVLAKTSQRNIERINALTGPQKLIQVYSVKSWIMIALMLTISASLTWLGAPLFWRGAVNLAIGLALLMSSLAYLKALQSTPA